MNHTRRRKPEFEFGIAPEALPEVLALSNGFYMVGHGVAIIFSDEAGSDVEGSINHETLHYVIEKVAGRKATKKFDKICHNYEELR